MEKMKAIVCTKYGPPEVLQLKEVEKPVPKKNEICIKIHATTATSSDCIIRSFGLPMWHLMRLMMGIMLGFGKPRNPILGIVAAGEVDSVGKDVKRFNIGDQVLAYTVKSAIKISFAYLEREGLISNLELLKDLERNIFLESRLSWNY